MPRASVRDRILTILQENPTPTAVLAARLGISPHATSVRVSRLFPTPRDFDLREPTLAVDPDSDPAVAETIKPEKHAVSMQLALRRRADQAGRRGTIAIGLKV